MRFACAVAAAPIFCFACAAMAQIGSQAPNDSGIATYQPTPPPAPVRPAPVPAPFTGNDMPLDAAEISAQNKIDAATAASEAGVPVVGVPVNPDGVVPPSYAPYPPSLGAAPTAAPADAPANPVKATDAALAPTPATPTAISSTDMIVRLQILDKRAARSKSVDVPAGTVLQYGSLDIRPERCWTDSAGTVSRQAALIEISEHKDGAAPAMLFAGWMFAGDPSISHLEHPYYNVEVTACLPKDAAKKEETTPPAAAKPTAKKAEADPSAASESPAESED